MRGLCVTTLNKLDATWSSPFRNIAAQRKFLSIVTPCRAFWKPPAGVPSQGRGAIPPYAASL